MATIKIEKTRYTQDELNAQKERARLTYSDAYLHEKSVCIGQDKNGKDIMSLSRGRAILRLTRAGSLIKVDVPTGIDSLSVTDKELLASLGFTRLHDKAVAVPYTEELWEIISLTFLGKGSQFNAKTPKKIKKESETSAWVQKQEAQRAKRAHIAQAKAMSNSEMERAYNLFKMMMTAACLSEK